MFHDRTYASFLLENQLRRYKNKKGVVLAIAPGGMPIGYQLGRLLHMPFDILISTEIPHPFRKEFAIGAVCGSDVVLDQYIDKSVSEKYIQQQVHHLKDKAETRFDLFHKNRKPLPLKGETVILTDDGIASGHAMLAAVRNIRHQQPSKIVLAVPVASSIAYSLLNPEVDEFICMLLPLRFMSVSQFYESFPQITDEEVMHFLDKANVVVGEFI
ncbi:MAG: phosphoribosyltransferase family protein [Bacteroidota bacterium]